MSNPNIASTITPTPEAIPDGWLKKFHNSRRLNLAKKYYYESSLNKSRRFNRGIEITLGLTSASFLGLGFWNLVFPQQTVLFISAIAAAITAVIGILKPILRLSDKIEDNRVWLESCIRGDNQLTELASIIEKDKLLTIEEFKKIYASILRGIEVDRSGPDENRLGRYNNRVNNVLPEDGWRISYISTQSTYSSRQGDIS